MSIFPLTLCCTLLNYEIREGIKIIFIFSFLLWINEQICSWIFSTKPQQRLSASSPMLASSLEKCIFPAPKRVFNISASDISEKKLFLTSPLQALRETRSWRKYIDCSEEFRSQRDFGRFDVISDCSCFFRGAMRFDKRLALRELEVLKKKH